MSTLVHISAYGGPVEIAVLQGGPGAVEVIRVEDGEGATRAVSQTQQLVVTDLSPTLEPGKPAAAKDKSKAK